MSEEEEIARNNRKIEKDVEELFKSIVLAGSSISSFGTADRGTTKERTRSGT